MTMLASLGHCLSALVAKLTASMLPGGPPARQGNTLTTTLAAHISSTKLHATKPLPREPPRWLAWADNLAGLASTACPFVALCVSLLTDPLAQWVDSRGVEMRIGGLSCVFCVCWGFIQGLFSTSARFAAFWLVGECLASTALIVLAISRAGCPTNMAEYADRLDLRRSVELEARPVEKPRGPNLPVEVVMGDFAFSYECYPSVRLQPDGIECRFTPPRYRLPPALEQGGKTIRCSHVYEEQMTVRLRERDTLRALRDEAHRAWFLRAGNAWIASMDAGTSPWSTTRQIARGLRPPHAATLAALLGIVASMRILRRRQALSSAFDALSLSQATCDGEGIAWLADRHLMRLPAPCEAGRCVVALEGGDGSSYREAHGRTATDVVFGSLETIRRRHEERLQAHVVWASLAVSLPSIPLMAWGCSVLLA